MNKELVKTEPAPLATVPDYIPEGRQGLENVGKEELSFPRIDVAQETSKAAKKAHSDYIAGIEAGDLYNTLTREIYKRPVSVIPILFYHSYIRFRPQDQGGGVLRMYDNTDNLRPEELVFGPNGEKPAVTTLWNFLCYLPEESTVAVVSMKSTSAKVAKQWLSLQTLFGNRPAYARIYVLDTEFVDKGSQSYFNYKKVKSTGFVSQEDFANCEQLYKQFAGKTIVADPGDDSEDAPAF